MYTIKSEPIEVVKEVPKSIPFSELFPGTTFICLARNFIYRKENYGSVISATCLEGDGGKTYSPASDRSFPQGVKVVNIKLIVLGENYEDSNR